MKKILLEIFCFCLFAPVCCLAQIVTIEPTTARAGDVVTIYFDATQGTAGLTGAQKVYMHTGAITASPSGTDWEYVVGNWGADDGVGEMTKVAGEENLWKITLSPSIREYYNVPAETEIYRLSMVFRNANGSAEGKGTAGKFCGGEVTGNGDIYVNLDGGTFLCIDSPALPDNFLMLGQSLDISATSRETSTMEVLVDEGSGFSPVSSTANTTQISYTYSTTAKGNFKIKVTADNGTEIFEEVINVHVYDENIAEKPASIKLGINYQADASKATLCLLAPGKGYVYLVGDFSNWEIKNNYLMQKTPNGEFFWLEIDGLSPGQEYVFQYWVDGNIRIGDPFADQVADPYNDGFIPNSVYPGLPIYDKKDYGIATVLQTNQEAYNWAATEAAWARPATEDLVIYELLVRDFLGSHDYKDLADTLSYLKRLGVNAIELMPIMEFEGNESWGYNPSYFFAPDKYYGSKNDLKAFIERAHQEGFAVILDMVLNHAFGQNPMVQLYWDQQNNRPSPDNIWFNPVPKHPFNVGYDFNHESTYTQSFVDSVNNYWLSEYHFDGYRFDLSKGFTQKFSADNDVAGWGAFDQSRIDILKRMANEIWEVDNDAYIILEHFADASEEDVLTDAGMLTWGNKNHDYRNAVAGNTSADLSGANTFDKVTYMESHDEQRLMYEAVTAGRSSGTYNIKDTLIALNRSKLAAAFFYTVPGPKMMWQFQELGYDVDINFNGRVGNKPLVWGAESLNYHNNMERQKLYKVHAAIINFVNTYKDVFNQGEFQWDASGEVRKINIAHADMDVAIIGNFGLSEADINPGFSKTGTWYDFFLNESREVTDVNAPITLAPGEFHIFTSLDTSHPEPGLTEIFRPVVVTDPVEFTKNDQIRLVFDAAAADPDGTSGLVGANKVYMYAGVILDGPLGTEWQNIIGNPGVDDGIGEMVKVDGETDKWEITFTPKTYFNIPEDERIFRIGMYFMDATNTNVGKGLGGKNIYLEAISDADGKIVTIDPEEFYPDTQVKIIFDAALADPAGTAGLVNADKVYMHAGPVTTSATSEDWDPVLVVGNWGMDDGIGEMAKVNGEDNKWEITLTPKSYFSVPDTKKIYRLGMVFRNADGFRQGKASGGTDIFIEVKPQNITGLSPLNISDEIKLYPNPANQLIHINLGIFNDQPFEILIKDLMGRTYLRQKVGGQIEITLDMEALPAGVYLIMGTGMNHSFVKKIIKELE